jgi:hypothetical protein
MSTKFTDIIIAVHGIGDQSRFSTVRSVANRLAVSKALLGESKAYPVAPQPLGYFHGAKESVSACLLDDADSLKESDLASIGFAEAFWADIPQEVLREGRTLEETKAWAGTVVARAKVLCVRAREASKKAHEVSKGGQAGSKPAAGEPDPNMIVPPDFNLASEVLDDIIETVYVLENLSMLADKAGLFKFDLREVLEDYLGDVQLVTEFADHRIDVVGRFHKAMEDIYQKQCELGNENVRLHIVAHSEGTVVSFLGLLHAMHGRRFSPANPKAAELKEKIARVEDPKEIPDWLKHVHGYMTIGSPIDKHLLLWQRLWTDFDHTLIKTKLPDEQIRWRNYYDHGDPVGFKLDSTRLWLRQKGIKAFEFCACKDCEHDIGFSRYLLPGAAHNEYWSDPEVFEHFITNVVKRKPGVDPKLPPRSRWFIRILSPALPYLCSFLLLMLGVFVLFKAVHAYTHPSYDPLQKLVRFKELGITPAEEIHDLQLFFTVFGISALIAGSTYLTLFPRLAFGKLWKLVGIAALLAGCAIYANLVPEEVRNEIGAKFLYLSKFYEDPLVYDLAPTLGILGITSIAGLSGFLAVTGRFGNPDRQQRWFLRGKRPLIICGASAVGLIVILQILPAGFIRGLFGDDRPVEIIKSMTLTLEQSQLIKEAHLTPGELQQVIDATGAKWLTTLKNVKPVLASHPPIWPVLLAGMAFLYLWWLSTLLSDLAFVWHRYIRHATTNARLHKWNPYRLPPIKIEEKFCK